jgi:hypothetical protein
VLTTSGTTICGAILLNFTIKIKKPPVIAGGLSWDCESFEIPGKNYLI